MVDRAKTEPGPTTPFRHLTATLVVAKGLVCVCDPQCVCVCVIRCVCV